MSLLTTGRITSVLHGQRVDTAVHQQHKGVRRSADRHYDTEQGKFVPDKAQDPLLCQRENPQECYLFTGKDGEKVIGPEIPEEVWFGVVKDRLEVVVKRPMVTREDLIAAVHEGMFQVFSAPVAAIGDPQGAVEISKSVFPVWEACSRCGKPVDPDSNSAIWTGQKVYCTSDCQDAADPKRSYAAPSPLWPTVSRWTDRLYWNPLLGWTWERVPLTA